MTTLLASILTLLHPPCAAPHLEPVHRTHFSLCHDSVRKIPIWVAYSLTPAQFQPTAPPALHPRPRFHRDPSLSLPGATDSDYLHSSFTRGHMAPAADFTLSPEARRFTFALSNAAPQTPALNLGRWSQLESLIRRIAIQSDALIVVTGPIFDPASEPQFIGPNRVAVPTHFFKVVLVTNRHQRTAFGFILPNIQEPLAPLHAYLTTVDDVEQRTGLDFFSFLADPEESTLESLRSLPSSEATRQ